MILGLGSVFLEWWLGWDWEDRLYFASDYFGQMYDFAAQLIKAGKAYVCDLNAEETREHRRSQRDRRI